MTILAQAHSPDHEQIGTMGNTKQIRSKLSWRERERHQELHIKNDLGEAGRGQKGRGTAPRVLSVQIRPSQGYVKTPWGAVETQEEMEGGGRVFQTG